MQSRPFRTLLFVPAVKPDWMREGAELGADALVLDLEDAVPEAEKEAARGHAAGAIPDLARAGVGVFVRINPHSSPHWRADLEAVVMPGLTGVALPKVYRRDEVVAVAEEITACERRVGVEPGETDVQVLLETALAIRDASDVLGASPRVRSFFAGTARGGDLNRELGFRWSRGGRETFAMRSLMILEGRAAGVPHPISGTWVDLSDPEGLRAFAEESRDLGYEGMYVIHPSHVESVNRAFTPPPEELERCRTILAELERARAAGLGSTALDGAMIDSAMEAHARQVLALAEQIGQGGD